jgi:predicted Na+-dependent transporter
MALKQAAISISMMVFVLSSMLGMGLGLRVRDIVAPLRNWRLVMLSLVANSVLMPFAAVALARILRLDESMAIGLLLRPGRRRALLANTRPDLQGQSRVCRRTDLGVGVAVGWALGGSTRETRSVMGLGTAQRNIAAALVVANQSFEDPNVGVMVVVVAIVGLLTLMPLSRALGQRVPAATAAASADTEPA